MERTFNIISILLFKWSVINGFLVSLNLERRSLSVKVFERYTKRDNGTQEAGINRRQMFGDVVKLTTGCLCICGSPRASYGLAQLVTPNREMLEIYDVARNPINDAAFAQGMAVGMVNYEREAFPRKKKLFSSLFSSLEGTKEPVIVELGMGSFPNALYYKNRKGLDIIGIDPNDRMEGYAKKSASRANILLDDSLRIVHGVSEALPLADNSVDAVVCTLTLCSVLNPSESIEEIKRVLKPGGKFLFWEHVLSEINEAFAKQQIQATPMQVRLADGCHLDRRTGEIIKAAGFKKLDIEYFELENFNYLNPTVCGIATA